MNAAIIASLRAAGFDSVVSSGDLYAHCRQSGIRGMWAAVTESSKAKKVGRGKWDISRIIGTPETTAVAPVALEATVTPITKAAKSTPVVEDRTQVVGFEPRIPEKDANFIPYGEFSRVRKIIGSNRFCAYVVSGETGNGKTKMIFQACAVEKRALIPVSMEMNTTEDELIGKYVLRDGTMVYEEGPVLVAMQTGSVLLLDELDRAMAENLTCLHTILDGYAYLDKKTGKYITPAPGFQIIATMNTKGQGDVSDRYVAAKVLDEAFLERFAGVLVQQYPSPTQETKLLAKLCEDEKFVESLVKWANVTRNTYRQGGISNFITTRRLTKVVENFHIFGDVVDAVELGINRFEDEMKESLLELFKAIHGGTYADQTVDTKAE